MGNDGNVIENDASGIGKVCPETLRAVEADCYWCLNKILDGIQDNYTHGQPGILFDNIIGIHRQINRLSDLIARIDASLSVHLKAQGVEFIQFAFRWMNCMLMREISLKSTIRMWDSYQSDGMDSFANFHIYVCAAFLIKWSAKLKTMEFQDILMFLQSVGNITRDWGDKDIELLLSEAFMWKSLFQDSQAHLTTSSVSNIN